MLDRLCAPWQDALAVKLLVNNPRFNVMKDMLTRTWKLATGFNILDIRNNFYMVKFDKGRQNNGNFSK